MYCQLDMVMLSDNHCPQTASTVTRKTYNGISDCQAAVRTKLCQKNSTWNTEYKQLTTDVMQFKPKCYQIPALFCKSEI